MDTILLKNRSADDVKISCFGEVLWDVFPDGRRVGGAPLNMCLRLNSFGIKANIISGVGVDELGTELIDFVQSHGVSTEFIAHNAEKKTSTVQVTLDNSGSASYEIVADTAWDNITLSHELLNEVSHSDIFVFGSLVGRNDVSFNTLSSLLDHANFKVFDVNLRAPHYTKDMLIDLMNRADFIKLNDDELYEIAQDMGSPFHSLEQNLEFIATKTNTKYLCVTKGRHGALLKIESDYFYNSGYLIKVVDTVGAGDSFLGSLMYQLCTSDDAQQAVDFACAVGALVAQNKGATPELSMSDIQKFIYPTK